MKRILTLEDIPADVLEKNEGWQLKHNNFDPAQHSAALYALFRLIGQVPETDWDARKTLTPILSRFPKEGKGLYSKANLIAGYRHLVAGGRSRAGPAARTAHPHEADAHAEWCRARHCADRARWLPWQVHLLPGRLAHAQELYL